MEMQGSLNRFEFAKNTGGCVHPKLRGDWDRYGGKVFEMEVIETLEQQESQSNDEFQREVIALLDLITSQNDTEALY